MKKNIQNNISSSEDLSDSQGFANFMAASDKTQELQAFKKSMPTSTQSMERQQVQSRMQMYSQRPNPYSQQTQNPYRGGYQDEDYGFQEEEQDEDPYNDDPYNFDIDLTKKKKDTATSKYEERKKQLEQKRKEAKEHEEREEKERQEEQEKLRIMMEEVTLQFQRNKEMQQSSSSENTSGKLDNKYAKMQKEMKAFVQHRLNDNVDSEDFTESNNTQLKESNMNKYQESVSKSYKTGEDDDYSEMSSVKKSESMFLIKGSNLEVQASEYVDPIEMQRYLAQKQPEIAIELEEEKKKAQKEKEQINIKDRLKNIRDSQTSLSNHSQSDRQENTPTQKPDAQQFKLVNKPSQLQVPIPNLQQFTLNPNQNTESEQSQQQKQQVNQQQIQQNSLPQKEHTQLNQQAYNDMYMQQQVQYPAPQQPTQYNNYFPYPNNNIHYYQQEVDSLMQRLHAIEQENTDLKQKHTDQEVKNQHTEKYKNHREQYYREQSEQRAHVKYQHDTQLQIEELHFEIEKLQHQIQNLNNEIHEKNELNKTLLQKLKTTQSFHNDRNKLQEQILDLQQKLNQKQQNSSDSTHLEQLVKALHKENENHCQEIKKLKTDLRIQAEKHFSFGGTDKQFVEMKLLEQDPNKMLLVDQQVELNSYIQSKTVSKDQIQQYVKQIGDLKQQLLELQLGNNTKIENLNHEVEKYKIFNDKLQKDLVSAKQESGGADADEISRLNIFIETQKKENMGLMEKIMWYVENQQFMSKQDNEIKNKEKMIEDLQKQIEEVANNPNSKTTKDAIIKPFQDQREKDKKIISSMQQEISIYETQLSSKDPSKAAYAQKQIESLRELNSLRDENKKQKNEIQSISDDLNFKLNDLKQQYNKLFYLKNPGASPSNETQQQSGPEKLASKQNSQKKIQQQSKWPSDTGKNQEFEQLGTRQNSQQRLQELNQQTLQRQNFEQSIQNKQIPSPPKNQDSLQSQQSQEYQQKVVDLQNEIDSLKKEKESYQKQTSEAQQSSEKIKNDFNKQAEENQNLQDQIKSINQNLQKIQQQSDEKQKQIDELSQNQVSLNKVKHMEFELLQTTDLLNSLQTRYKSLQDNLNEAHKERDDLKVVIAGLPKNSSSIEIEVLERKLQMLSKQQQERSGGLGFQEKKRLEKVIEEKDLQIENFKTQFQQFMQQIHTFQLLQKK